MPRLRFSRDRLAIALSTLLRVACALLIVLWAASYLRVTAVTRRTTVLSGDVIEGTGGPIDQYISHTRALASVRGRVYFTYLRADELTKSKDLPRRVSWHFDVFPIRGGHARFKAPESIALLGLDWELGTVRQGGRPNGEYWANRDIVLCVPYWLPVLACGVGGWLIGRRARLTRRRLRRGECPACGYDVRATPDRCPECGLASHAVAEVARAGV